MEKESVGSSIQTIAYVDRRKLDFENVQVISPAELCNIEYDYIIICSSKYKNEILNEIIQKGISTEKVIFGELFLEKGFDFSTYKENKWLNNQIINNRVVCDSFEDKNRIYKGKSIELYLGRKSYSAEMIFENTDPPTKMIMNVGNYTSISWNVTIEIGLNADHDYHRVTNYGMTHLGKNIEVVDEGTDKECFLDNGSDVWIGRGSRIKSGIKIGDGAVVAANSYVVSDVPDYAIVGGNPARLVKYRFDDQTIADFKRIKWWLMPEKELLKYRELFDDPSMFIKQFLKNNETP